jgi:hypothetical protein
MLATIAVARKKTADKLSCRVVAMASLFELLGKVRFDDLEGYTSQESGVFEYSNSKIMVIMAAREMNKRLKVCSLYLDGKNTL